jgi:hypothetical protein
MCSAQLSEKIAVEADKSSSRSPKLCDESKERVASRIAAAATKYASQVVPVSSTNPGFREVALEGGLLDGS